VAKDKKKTKKADKKDKKGKGKGAAAGLLKSKPVKAAAKKVQRWTENPMVADIVAAALVASAAALKDPRKAQRLAAEAGDELEKMGKQGAERGNAMWQLALDIGRRSLEELAESGRSKSARKR
jgi:hypothetical protein